ncbi:MAG TPA: acyloxyacyl hydrolase [Gammaproteobacteria bacterium]|nr:acyloxyacyl hydrolase [Gammaproteobacteria bacterium]
MKRNLCVILCCFMLCYVNTAYATRSGVSIGAGQGTKHVRGYRFGMTRSWANDGVTPNKRKLTGYWELGFTQIHNPVEYDFPTNNNLEATSGSMVLRIPVKCLLQFYFDAGIGVAYLTNEEISTRDLGTRWLFEDRLGVGILFGPRYQYELGYRLIHFSNGYLAQVNQGINLHMVMLGYWL